MTTCSSAQQPQLFCDGSGSTGRHVMSVVLLRRTATQPAALELLSWEDDLIMTGVRSFDVKAYDNALAGYGDLGWGDDLRLYVPYQTNAVLSSARSRPHPTWASPSPRTAIPSFPYASVSSPSGPP